MHDDYLKMVHLSSMPKEQVQVNRAGSCGIMVINIEKDVYILNVGDSWAIMSKGQEIHAITVDHKPMEEKEF